MVCPICRGKVTSSDRSPFCSERCQRIDLANWLGEGYRIEGPPLETDRPALLDGPDGADGRGDAESSWN